MYCGGTNVDRRILTCSSRTATFIFCDLHVILAYANREVLEPDYSNILCVRRRLNHIPIYRFTITWLYDERETAAASRNR